MIKVFHRSALVFLLTAVAIPLSAQAQGLLGKHPAAAAAAPARAAPAARAAPVFHSAPAFHSVPIARATISQRAAPRVAIHPSAGFNRPSFNRPSFARHSASPRIVHVQRQNRIASRPSFRGKPAAIASTGAIKGRNHGSIASKGRGITTPIGNAAKPDASRGLAGAQKTLNNRGIAKLGGGRTPSVLRNAAFADRAIRARGNNALRLAAFRGRFAGAGLARSGWRHGWRHGRVLGWIGPLFWPYATYDVFYYAFYPYYEDTFWPYAYDDVYDGIFGPYAYVDSEVETIYSDGGRRSRRASRAGARQASAAGKPAESEICTQQSPGLTDFPIQRIAQTVEPNDSQKGLLDSLKDATAKAVDILQAACPTDLPSTPTGRMDALVRRLEAMVSAVQTVRPALEQFYNSLNDEQKARFNAVEDQPETANPRVARSEQTDLTRTCESGKGVTDVPIQRISQIIRPTGAQRDALDELKQASTDAASALKANCPSYAALTPVGRVELMEQRLNTLLQAAKTVQPALAKFYQSLSDEQKERFNTLGAQQS